MLTGEKFLVLGGGGMIGKQVVYEIARELQPRHIVICSLDKEEVAETIREFQGDFTIPITGKVADVFLRTEWNPHDNPRSSDLPRPLRRSELVEDADHRKKMYDDLFGDFDEAYRNSYLVDLIKDTVPDVVIDSINTATVLSYQDVHATSDKAKDQYNTLKSYLRAEAASGSREAAAQDEIIKSAERALEELLPLQSVQQLVRHVLLIRRAMKEVGTRLYLKIGTTGTGGMGLQIPYTHSEDKPSADLMAKTALAFAHTGLMFLMARTLGGPAVKEIKPGAMVGYARMDFRQITAKGSLNKIGEPGKPLPVWAAPSKLEPLGDKLVLRPPKEGPVAYHSLGNLEMVVVNTGENGYFAKGEFEAITHMRQMEFITPEEIARQVVLEIQGGNTGYDVIAAIDGAVMNPTYRAGYLRHVALEQLSRLEKEHDSPSVALGMLGPPELGKLLWEAQLLKMWWDEHRRRSTESNALKAIIERPAAELAAEIIALLLKDERKDAPRQMIISVGLPILVKNGDSLAMIRGPYIRIPEETEVEISMTAADVEKWAAKGWVDLRPKNLECWQERLKRMSKHESERIAERGSAAFTIEAYLSKDIEIGAVVGWIFNNEDHGYRIK